MPEHSEQLRLLVHDTVAVAVDTIIAAIQQEITDAEARFDEEGITRLERQFRNGTLAGLRNAKSAAAVASVAARSAAMHTRPVDEAAA